MTLLEILGPTIITAASVIIVQILINSKYQRVQDVKFDSSINEINTKLDITIKEIKDDISRLEKKQDKHNQLVERVTALEHDDAAQWKWIDKFKDKE